MSQPLGLFKSPFKAALLFVPFLLQKSLTQKTPNRSPCLHCLEQSIELDYLIFLDSSQNTTLAMLTKKNSRSEPAFRTFPNLYLNTLRFLLLYMPGSNPVSQPQCLWCFGVDSCLLGGGFCAVHPRIIGSLLGLFQLIPAPGLFFQMWQQKGVQILWDASFGKSQMTLVTQYWPSLRLSLPVWSSA